MVKHDGNRFASREEIEIGVGDGVIPVDGAVIGATGSRTK